MWAQIERCRKSRAEFSRIWSIGGQSGKIEAFRPTRDSKMTEPKWSDWSECLENCVKVRHRRYCDDLLASKQNASQQGEQSRRLRILNKIKRQIKEQLKRETDNDDNLDFGAELSGDPKLEGDLEDEKDTCAGVELSQTYEELPCSGDLCIRRDPHLSPVKGANARGQTEPRRSKIGAETAVSRLDDEGE